MGWVIFKKYNKDAHEKLLILQERSADTVKGVFNQRSYQRRLQALKPKLEVIEKRMQALEREKKVKNTMTEYAVKIDDWNISFDAEKLFDLLDADASGDLDYDELKNILKFKPAQLREFIYRMNQAAGEDQNTSTVTKAVFVKHFIPVLEAASHFEPTKEECEELFFELAELGTVHGDIPHENFFKSSIATFLTETQIHELLKRFQKIKDSGGDPESGGNNRRRSMGKRVKSGGEAKNSQTYLFAPSNFVGISERQYTISRDLFVSRYPGLLLEVMEWTDQISHRPDQAKLTGGVDIAFRNLCLSVKVKDKSVNVVNNVTGRLQRGKMTALMGGSGAG